MLLEELFTEKKTSYVLQEVLNTTYKSKNETSPQEAFAFLQDLKPNVKNAFLMKSVLKLSRRERK